MPGDDVTINEGFTTRGEWATEMIGDPVRHHFDVAELGAGVARAIRDAAAQQIRAITATVTERTFKQRQYARAALARGAAWAVERYAGGIPSSSSEQLFNDSERFASGLTLDRQPDGSWTTSAPHGRLDASRFGSTGAFERMVIRLRELVPVLRDPFSVETVARALAEAHAKLFAKR